MNPDTFLDDQTIAYLADDLRSIARNHPELLRIARRETSPPGGRAARNPNGYQSRPPVNIAALSTSHELQAVLHGWTRCLADDAGIEPPKSSDTGTLAAHLAGRSHEIAQQAWADDCASEMKHWAKILHGYTSEIRQWEGQQLRWVDPQDLDDALEKKFLTEAHTIELHFHLTGQRLSGSTLRTWRQHGVLPKRRDNGVAVYWYEEVKHAVAQAPKAEGRHAQNA